MAQFRYLVREVDAAVAFYTGHLAFHLEEQFGSAMAIVSRGDVRLWLAGPTSSAARPMRDGSSPQPGGWNRIVLEVEDLTLMVDRLHRAGVPFRNEIVKGPGGQQTLCEDPSGNPIELFQPS
ncbi:MAG: VOC family protein [Thermoplasmata archaeon]|nr:VOC family protein [Thermoplasmata archaeon]